MIGLGMGFARAGGASGSRSVFMQAGMFALTGKSASFTNSGGGSNDYTAEDGTTVYTAENGTTHYVSTQTDILSILSSIAVPSPYVYATGVALGGILSPSSHDLVMAYGADLNVDSTGGVSAFDSSGSVIWTYHAPNTAYGMGVGIGDVDGDGHNEVAVGFRVLDPLGVLLDHNGSFLWSWNAGAGIYVRVAEIGKLTADAGLQVFFAGSDGNMGLFKADGTTIWTKNLGSGGGSASTIQSAKIADTDGDGQNEIILLVGNKVRKYDNTGTQIWSVTLGDSLAECYGVAVGKTTNSVAGLQIIATVGGAGSPLEKVVCLDKDGNILWSYNTPSPAYSCAVGDINSDGLVEVFVGYGTHELQSPPDLGTGGVTMLSGAGVPLASMHLPSSPKFITFGATDGSGINHLVVTDDSGHAHIILAS